MFRFFAVGLLCALQAVRGAVVCQRGISSPLPIASFAPGRYFWWRCEQNPYATEMWYTLLNPDGFRLQVTVADGINDCNSNDMAVGAKPEVSYPALGLTNVTMGSGSCNQVPCCIKVACDRANSGNCSAAALQYRFTNALDEVPSSVDEDAGGILMEAV
jgi:hypothetical protein